MRVLVAITQPISGDALAAAIGDDADEAEIMLIAPALDRSAVRFWVSDADDAVARSQAIERRRAALQDREGASIASNGIPDIDLTAAVKDALVTFAAERVVLFLHPPREGRYRERVEAEALSYELGLPVEVHPVESPSEGFTGRAGNSRGGRSG